jgi:hypothetical protein
MKVVDMRAMTVMTVKIIPIPMGRANLKSFDFIA